MSKLEVRLKFLNTLPDLARKFRFASDTIDKIDSDRVMYVCPKCNTEFLGVDKKCPNCGWDELINCSVYSSINGQNMFLGENDKRIIYQYLVDTENPHKQLRKTISIDYEIYNVTRALLQEFARHPMGNPFVVKSTRYALHRIAKDDRIGNDLIEFEPEDIVADYYFIPENDFVEPDEKLNWIENRLYDLEQIKYYKTVHNMKNDQLKKYVNDYFLTNITGNISGEALWNLLKQRLDNVAWYQFQDLAKEMYNQIPDEWKPLFKVFKYQKLNLGTDNLKEIKYKLMQLYTENKLVEKKYLVEE